MRRLVLSLLAVATLPLGATSCGSKKPTAVVVAVSTEALPPSEVDTLVLRVERSGSEAFSNEYSLADGNTPLPGTITLENQGKDASETMRVTVLERLGSKDRVLRTATLAFSDQKTKLLRMPLRYSCMDQATPCPDGQSCIGGACVDAHVDVESLPDFAPELVFGTAGSSACFDEGEQACLASLADVDLTKLGADCSLPVAAANGKLNLAAHWDKALDPTRLVVLDQDAQEGWTFVDAKETSIRLAPGICAAVKAKHLVSLRASTACSPKQITQPICQAAPSGGGAGGAGGANDPCPSLAQAFCAKAQTCVAGASTTSVADCTSTLGTLCDELVAKLPGIDPAGMMACNGVIGQASCDDFRSQAWRCAPTGNLPDGAACIDSAECKNGRCYRPSGTGQCGICGAQGNAGDPCEDLLAKTSCKSGLTCRDGKCQTPLLGSACTTATDCSGANDTLTCSGGKCVDGHAKAGDSCTGTDPSCASVDASLVCDGKQCVAAPPPAQSGQPCGPVGPGGNWIDCATNLGCKIDPASTSGGGTCAIRPKLGQPCDPSVDCQDGGYCADATGTKVSGTTTGTCVALPTMGQSCVKSGNECAGLTQECKNGTCVDVLQTCAGTGGAGGGSGGAGGSSAGGKGTGGAP